MRGYLNGDALGRVAELEDERRKQKLRCVKFLACVIRENDDVEVRKREDGRADQLA